MGLPRVARVYQTNQISMKIVQTPSTMITVVLAPPLQTRNQISPSHYDAFIVKRKKKKAFQFMRDNSLEKHYITTLHMPSLHSHSPPPSTCSCHHSNHQNQFQSLVSLSLSQPSNLSLVALTVKF